MFASYQATAPDRSGVVSAGNPELISSFLRCEASWPPGRYEITSVGFALGELRRRWGVATKHADGSVDLIPDQPA